LRDHPFAQIGFIEEAGCERPLIAISSCLFAGNDLSPDLVSECERGDLATEIGFAVFRTDLAAFRGIEPLKSSALKYAKTPVATG
jgi:hypothetical protein